MPEVERRATWKLMLGEESTTRVIIDTFDKAGFDINRDLLQSYKFIEGQTLPQWRDVGYGGGILVDWNLKTSLDGLYAAGTQMFAPEDHSHAASTGRYAGRKAAAYAREIGSIPNIPGPDRSRKSQGLRSGQAQRRRRVERAARRDREGDAVLRQRI